MGIHIWQQKSLNLPKQILESHLYEVELLNLQLFTDIDMKHHHTATKHGKDKLQKRQQWMNFYFSFFLKHKHSIWHSLLSIIMHGSRVSKSTELQ
jgi:hypothetical protein